MLSKVRSDVDVDAGEIAEIRRRLEQRLAPHASKVGGFLQFLPQPDRRTVVPWPELRATYPESPHTERVLMFTEPLPATLTERPPSP